MSKQRRKQDKGSALARAQEPKGLQGSPVLWRIVAFVCDYVIAGVCAMAITLLPYTYLTGGQNTVSLAAYADVGVGLPTVAALVCASILVTWIYFALLPATRWEGKTLGKRWANLEVVMADGSKAGLGVLTLRWLMLLLVEIPGIFAMTGVMQLLGELGLGDLAFWWETAGRVVLVASFIVMLASTNHRSIHDFAVGTWVYNGN